MTAVFDTLKFAQALRDKANLTLEQAEGIAEAFAGATGEQLVTKDYLDARLEITKTDILKWVVGAIGLQTVAFILMKVFGH